MNPEHVYLIDPVELSRQALTLPRDALRVAMLFDGHRRLWEVVRDSHLSSRMTMSVFGRLVDIDVLQNPTFTAVPATVDAPEHDEIEENEPIEPIEDADRVNTARLPRMVVVAPEPCADTVRMDSAEILAAEPEATEVPLAKAPAAPPPATSPIPEPAFDASDETFFESYEPEDDSVDTFWDLEVTPHARRKARRRQERLQRGGWFRQLLSIF